MPNKVKPIVIEKATLVFENFAGRETQYNEKGDRNFSVVLDDETADRLTAEGWNVKCKLPDEEDATRFCHLPVTVKYNKYPPVITLISSAGRTLISEDIVGTLDGMEFDLVDLVINPYEWDFNGNQGVKAYLKTAFLTLREDALMLKYAQTAD